MSVLRRLPIPFDRVEGAIELRRLRALIASRPWESVVVVSGMRRAGNHAVIGWLANAYEETSVELHYDQLEFGISSTGVTAHVNDIPILEDCPGPRVARLRRGRQSLEAHRSAGRLIISFEDIERARIDSSSFLPREVSARVNVRRPTLNLLASRQQKFAAEGETSSYAAFLRIDQALLDRIAADAAPAAAGWTVLDFDDWSSGDPQYRSSVLAGLGLSVDISPGVTRHGGGSSFTGKASVPESTDLRERWRTVIWPIDLLDLFLLDRNRGIFTGQERERLEQLRDRV